MIHTGTEIRTWLPKSQAATFIIAASDSLHRERADYVCDGNDDNVEIQMAIDACLDAGGGKVQLLEGQFTIGAPIKLYVAAYEPSNIWLAGMGTTTTRILLANNSNCNMIENVIVDANSGWKFVTDLEMHGGKTNQASGHGFYQALTGAGSAFDMRLLNIIIWYCKEDGFHIEDAWGTYIDNCLSEYNDGIGLSFEGIESYIANFHSSLNKGYGAKLTGRLRVSGMEINGSGTYGLFLTNVDFSTINNIYISTWGREAYGAGVYMEDNSIHSCIDNLIIDGDGTGDCDDGFNLRGNYITLTNFSISGVKDAIFGTGSNNQVNGGIITATGTHINLNATNVVYRRHSDLFMDVLAVSATHIRSNEALNAAIPITFTIDAQPDTPRTLSGHFDSHANITEYDIEIIGTDAKGNTLTEEKDETDLWDWETNNAFATITSIKMTSRTGTGAGDTMDIGITDVLGLSDIIYATSDVYKIKKNNANATVAAAQVNTTYDTYDMAVIGLANTDDFTIWYKSNLNIII